MYVAARSALACFIVNGVEYDQHELPSGYLGDPFDDLQSLKEARELAAQAIPLSLRATLVEKVTTLEADANDWIRLRDQMRGLDWDTRLSIWRARPVPLAKG